MRQFFATTFPDREERLAFAGLALLSAMLFAYAWVFA